MSTKIFVSGALMALGGLAFSPVLPAMAASPDMKVLDPDADGTISLAEAQAAGVKKFHVADADHDGTVDGKEAGPTVASADSDKDGTLDAKEYAAEVASAFKAADPDGDGTLDAKELGSPEGDKLLSLIQ